MNLPRMLRTVCIAAFCCAAQGADTSISSYVVTNDDVPFAGTATFHAINADGTLGAKISVATGGSGIGGGFFAAEQVVAMPNSCVYVSNAGSGDIAGINAATHTVTGNFFGSSADAGTGNGIGLAANAHYLYASYTDSSTIGTFQLQPGCMLQFAGDTFAIGLANGIVDGMAVHGNMLVVSYGDGSIESFNIAGGVPVSNGDLQNSTGAAADYLPNGVTITRDGHYAIFGDAATATVVEVSDISLGKLAPSIAYSLGAGFGSSTIRLSPDETVLFVTNDSSGQLTAAFFDKSTGKLSTGCISGTLNDFYKEFVYGGRVGLELAQGTGGTIYYPEYGAGGRSSIGILEFTSSGSACTLTEAANSPVTNPNHNAYVLSLAVHHAAL